MAVGAARARDGSAGHQGARSPMSSSAITLLVVAILLVPLAGIFAALDAALQRVSKARVEEMRREGVKNAAALEEVVDERARHVALLLLLRIVCEMVAAVIVNELPARHDRG